VQLSVLPYGKSASRECRVVTLCWQSARLDDQSPELAIKQVAQTSGVYAIEARRDGASHPGVVYVGRTGSEKTKRAIATRLNESMGRVRWKTKKGGLRLFSDVWDVQIRWATIDEGDLIKPVERILTVSHAPPFNAQQVRVTVPKHWADILVLNGGRKGHLLPSVFGGYYCPGMFEAY
jgi:hypothetical protein